MTGEHETGEPADEDLYDAAMREVVSRLFEHKRPNRPHPIPAALFRHRPDNTKET